MRELFIREVEMDASFLFSVIKLLILIYNQTYCLGVDSSDSQPQPEDIVSFFPSFILISSLDRHEKSEHK